VRWASRDLSSRPNQGEMDGKDSNLHDTKQGRKKKESLLSLLYLPKHWGGGRGWGLYLQRGGVVLDSPAMLGHERGKNGRGCLRSLSRPADKPRGKKRKKEISTVHDTKKKKGNQDSRERGRGKNERSSTPHASSILGKDKPYIP